MKDTALLLSQMDKMRRGAGRSSRRIDGVLINQSDTLAELLAAQCTDLERLLALARLETQAAERSDFSELLRVTEERATIGERLEVYHRQLAEVRARLDDTALDAHGERAAQIIELAVAVQTQDARTRPLLLAARAEITEEGARSERLRRGASAYLSDARMPASVYDTNA